MKKNFTVVKSHFLSDKDLETHKELYCQCKTECLVLQKGDSEGNAKADIRMWKTISIFPSLVIVPYKREQSHRPDENKPQPIADRPQPV